MSNANVMQPIPLRSSRPGATVVVVYYLITLVAGAFILSFHGRFAFATDFFIAVFWLAATVFLYGLSRPVSEGHSSRATSALPATAHLHKPQVERPA